MSRGDNGAPPPPQIEEELIGLVLLNLALYHDLSERLRAEDFSHPLSACIWRAVGVALDHSSFPTLGMIAASARNVPDDVLLSTHLPMLMAEATDASGDPVAVQDLVDMIVERARKRSLGEAFVRLHHEVADPNVLADDLVAKALQEIVAVGGVRADRFTANIGTLVGNIARDLSDPAGPPPNRGISIGIEELEQLAGQWMPGDLIVLGAKSGDGKTGVAMQIGVHVGKTLPVEFFELEMDGLAVAERQLATETGIPVRRIRSGGVNAGEIEAVNAAAIAVRGNKLMLRWRPKATTAQIRGIVLGTKAREGRVGLVIVDHNKLVRVAHQGRRLDRVEQIALAMDDLKALAKEAACPVLVLAQMTREGLKRITAGGFNAREMRPHSWDLYGGGDMEEYADIILLAHRPENKVLGAVEPKGPSATRGNPTPQEEWKATVAHWTNRGEFIAEKVRNGASGGHVQMFWNGERTRYEPLPTIDDWMAGR